MFPVKQRYLGQVHIHIVISRLRLVMGNGIVLGFNSQRFDIHIHRRIQMLLHGMCSEQLAFFSLRLRIYL